jgi:hypothetical protein
MTMTSTTVCKRASWALFAAMVALFPLSAAHATLTQINQYNSSETAFAGNVSNSDLLAGLTGVHVNFMSTGNPINLNNGVLGAASDTGAIAWAKASGTTSTWDLGLGPNLLGWDLTAVRSFAAWNSAKLHNQAYDVYIKQVGAASYTFLANIVYDATVDGGGAGGSTQVTLSDTVLGAAIATNVQFIQFQYLQGPGMSAGLSTTFREIDVIGIASVPEPTSSVLATIAAIAVGAGSNRRRITRKR